MSQPPYEEDHSQRNSRLLLVGGSLLLVALGFWIFSGQEKVPEPQETAATDEGPDEPEPEPERKAAAVPPPSPPTTTVSAEAPPERPPSHPLGPERERIQLENRYVQALNDAMDLKDAKKLRQIVAEYRAEGFEDVEKFGDGYEIVANCIEYPGEASRAAAQHFFDTYRASILRRFIKRHCLE